MKNNPHWMKHLLIAAVCLSGTLFCRAEIIFEKPFETDSGRMKWQLPESGKISNGVLTVRSDGTDAVAIARTDLPAKKTAGRMIRFSGEYRTRDLVPSKRPNSGGKIMFVLQDANGKTWRNRPIPKGTSEWEKFEQILFIRPGMRSGKLEIGLQNASGALSVRNLKLETIAMPVDLRGILNRPLSDDPKGIRGWTGQGAENDGRAFRSAFHQTMFFGIPFALNPDGNAVLLLKSRNFPKAPMEAHVNLPEGTEACANSLYLLHTLSWAPRNGEKIGEIVLSGKSGREQRIAVSAGQDAGDWWMPKRLANGAVAIRRKNGAGEYTGFYLSKFNITPGLGPIQSIRFRSVNGKAIWIVAGATLSDGNHPLPPVRIFTVRENSEWKPYERSPKNIRLDGSALDVRPYLPTEKAGAHGRVMVNPDGHFAFQETPDKPVRFFACAIQSAFSDKEAIRQTMTELRKNGYNMIRTHFLDNQLMSGAKKDLELNPERLDLFDYMVFQMKENGIYLNFDAMTSWNGYTPGNCWAAKDKNKMKYSIYFDPAARKNWRKGVEKILTRINPYTKTRLIDDPVLAMIVGFNEQEFAFVHPFDGTKARSEWRNFLKQRHGSIERWRQANPNTDSKIRSFAEIPMFTNRTAEGNDATAFIRRKEEEIMSFYRDSLRAMGYRGVLTNYNMGKSLHYNRMRAHMDFSAINHYHAHPTDAGISQRSSISGAGRIFRNLAATRPADKPLIVTEHNHVFWNRYRYEQGFVTGCYAAFQGFDGLTAHATPVSLEDRSEIRSFRLYADPIAAASEFLTFFAFIRGDVAPAKHGVRIEIDPADLEQAAAARSSLSDAQTKLALLTAFRVEIPERNVHKPLRRGEILLARNGGAKVVTNQAGFAATVEEEISADELVSLLKKKGILPAANRSDGNHLFESETGELLLDASRCFLSVDTPRLQGICGEAGAKAALSDFSVLEMTCRGNLAVVAVDGLKPIHEAERMVLVYATNALNSGMKFESPEMTARLDNGGMPVLLQRGQVRFSIRNKTASELVLYTLDASGKRLKRFAPESVSDGKAVFHLNTAGQSCGVFFEIIREKHERENAKN